VKRVKGDQLITVKTGHVFLSLYDLMNSNSIIADQWDQWFTKLQGTRAKKIADFYSPCFTSKHCIKTQQITKTYKFKEKR